MRLCLSSLLPVYFNSPLPPIPPSHHQRPDHNTPCHPNYQPSTFGCLHIELQPLIWEEDALQGDPEILRQKGPSLWTRSRYPRHDVPRHHLTSFSPRTEPDLQSLYYQSPGILLQACRLSMIIALQNWKTILRSIYGYGEFWSDCQVVDRHRARW